VERITSSVTSVSWIPSEMVDGLLKVPFEVGFINYDRPLPDQLGDLEEWRRAGRFRFANRLEAWIDVEDGEVVGSGHLGSGVVGRTGLGPGKLVSVPAIAFPDIQRDPEPADGGVRFVQTSGGQPPLLAPRRTSGAHRWSLRPPVVWTTLALTIRVDGSVESDLIGASPFPRHWIYGPDGSLRHKAGLTDFDDWYHRASLAEASPWAGVDVTPVLADAETPLERVLSARVMASRPKPRLRTLEPGTELTRQGEIEDAIYLVLDGVLEVDVDGEVLCEVGPGVIVGERARLDAGGRRTATLRATTRVKAAVVDASAFDEDMLGVLAQGHRREGAGDPSSSTSSTVEPPR
jgi:hypothetical protein